MGYFSSLDTSASGMTAQRVRMDTISQNIANANSTRTESGGPYRRKNVVFEERSSGMSFKDHLSKITGGESGFGGVRVVGIVEDTEPFKRVYDPSHPDANQEGYLDMPNIDVVTEMINMISATRAYEANITALNSTKGMAMKALEIGR